MFASWDRPYIENLITYFNAYVMNNNSFMLMHVAIHTNINLMQR